MPPPALIFSIAAPITAAIAAALVETIPVRLDDNLSVAATAGILLLEAVLRRCNGFERLATSSSSRRPRG